MPTPGSKEGDLSIAQVALLANMDEKSVRNAANPKSKDPLRTVSDGRGIPIRHGSKEKIPRALRRDMDVLRTTVRVSDARDWLSRRRGFTPTKQNAAEHTPTLPALGFSNLQDLASFVKARREWLKLSPSQLASKAKSLALSPDTVKAIERGECDLGIGDLIAVGKALQVDPKAFASAAATVSIAAFELNGRA